MKLNLTADISEVEDALYKSGLGVKDAKKKVLSTVARGMKTSIQRGVYGKLTRKTGKLRSSIKAVVKQTYSYVVPRPYGKAYILEFGGRILPMKKKYLTFKMGDKWIKSSGVNIKPHPFFHRGGEAYLHTQYKTDMDKIVEDAVLKYWK